MFTPTMFLWCAGEFQLCLCNRIQVQQTPGLYFTATTHFMLCGWTRAHGPAGLAQSRLPHINLSVLLPLITGEVQPKLQVQGAHRGKRLQHLCLPPLEARRQADVCLAERTGEAAARSQGPAEAPVHPLPAHAPILAAGHRTLSGIRLPRLASPTMLM